LNQFCRKSVEEEKDKKALQAKTDYKKKEKGK
jgi:hypothetical protein